METENNHFVWNDERSEANLLKHGVDFFTAAEVFLDESRKVFADLRHSHQEKRYFCIGKVGGKILTVRFTNRSGKIRIIGAGYWRKGEKIYEAEKET